MINFIYGLITGIVAVVVATLLAIGMQFYDMERLDSYDRQRTR